MAILLNLVKMKPGHHDLPKAYCLGMNLPFYFMSTFDIIENNISARNIIKRFLGVYVSLRLAERGTV